MKKITQDQYFKKVNDISFIPTMGNLHDGHLSLINKAKEFKGPVVVSIFINPLQFNNPNDLNKYPRTIDNDIKLLESIDVDYLYTPNINILENIEEIKANNYKNLLCDKYRPGHFDGVVTIVNKLFTLVEPQRAFFGLKDYQQLLHVKNLPIINDLNIDIIPCETIRSNDGLAMSSRNNLLSKEGLKVASNIYKSIKRVKDSISVNQNILNEEIDYLSKLGIEIEYYQICDQDTLEPINHKINNKFIVAIAAYVEGIRLIDNILSDQ